MIQRMKRIGVGIRRMQVVTARGAWAGFVAGRLGIFGAFVLAVDKGALTLVLTAFDTLPDAEFEGIYPALQTLLEHRGWLWIVWFLPLLPIGYAVSASHPPESVLLKPALETFARNAALGADLAYRQDGYGPSYVPKPRKVRRIRQSPVGD